MGSPVVGSTQNEIFESDPAKIAWAVELLDQINFFNRNFNLK